MKNLYTATITSWLKKSFIITLLSLGCIVASKAQNVSVTATLGTPTGSYGTLKAAFDAINSGTHQGTITINIVGNTTETATAVLNSSIAPANYSSVTIRPSGGARTIQGNIDGALIKLYGADNVVINGSMVGSPTRDLTIRNTSNGFNAVGIWVGSVSASNGANDNVIINTIVRMADPTTSYFCIVQSSGTSIGSNAEGPNNNNLYANNELYGGYNGIGLIGNSTNLDVENSITNNIIGNKAVPTEQIGYKAMHIANQNNVNISENYINGVNGISGSLSLGEQLAGIYFVGTINGGIVERNNISDITVAGPWGAAGIYLYATNNNTGLTIANNFISDIKSGGWNTLDSPDDNGIGISVVSGGGYKFYYNTVHINTSNTSSSVSNQSSALFIYNLTSIVNLEFKNNIFANTAPHGTNFTVVTQGNPLTQIASSNTNAFYSSTNNFGKISSTNINSLAAWQTASGQDLGSVETNPQFVSTTDLHLGPNSPLDALATPLPGFTADIDFEPRNVTNPDIGADEFTPPNCTSATNAGTITSSLLEICGSGSPFLTSSGYSYGLGSNYQWQQSTNGGATWTNIPGQTNPYNGTPGTISATTSFRLRVDCNGSNVVYSNVITVNVFNPVTNSTTGATRCGVGTVTLNATSSSPTATLHWYDSPTGGIPLGTGNSFVTPVISSTTTYYVGVREGGGTFVGGKSMWNTGDGGYSGDAGIVFNAHEDFVLESVRVFPEASGTITIAVTDNVGNIIPGLSSTFSVTTNTTTGIELMLNFDIPAGNNYRLMRTDFGPVLKRDFSTGSVSYPYNIGTSVTLTGGYFLGSSSAYYYFYDWKVTTGCEGVRTPVVATVTPPPAVNITPAPGTIEICGGTSVTLTASSSASPAYTYTWQPGNLTGNSIVVAPDFTTSYTLTASNGTCVNVIDDILVKVFPTPTPITVTPTFASVCAGTVLEVNTTGGLVPEIEFFSEKFESFPLPPYNTSNAPPTTRFAFRNINSSITHVQNTSYFIEGSSSVHIIGYSVSDEAFLTSQPISIAGNSDIKLKFNHIAAVEGTAISHSWDEAVVQYSINGTSWDNIPATYYQGSGAVFGGIVKFNKASYPDWESYFSVSTVPLPTAPATSFWKEETINISGLVNAVALGAPTIYIRFRYKTDASVAYPGWLIDNVRMIGIAPGTITWSPNTNLYMDAAHTIPYTGQSTGKVYYYAPGGAPAQVYTVTAASSGVCTRTTTTEIESSSSLPGVSIINIGSATYCTNDSIRVQAIPVNAINPSFRWGVDISGNGTLEPGEFVDAGASPTLMTKVFSPNQVPPGANIIVQMVAVGTGTCPSVNMQSAPFALTIYQSPTVTITGSNAVCVGSSVILTANTTGNITTYEWYHNGLPVGGNTSTLTVTDPGTYFVVVTSDLGCKTTSANFVLNQPLITIDIYAGPNGSITPPAPDLTIPCGTEVTFTITPNPGYSIADVLVNGLSVGAVATYTYIPEDGDLVEAFFEIFGCANPPTAFAGFNTSICADGTYLLNTPSPSIGGSASSATWSTSGTGTFNGGGVFGTATTYTPSAADVIAGSVTITLTTNDPDGAGDCIASTSSFVLSFRELPVVTMAGETQGICSAGATSATLTGNATFSGTITGLQWYQGAVPLGTSNTQLVNSPGYYILTATGDNGCIGRDTTEVFIYEPPTVTINGTPFFCTNGSTTLGTSANGGDGTLAANSFQWYYNNAVIPGAVFGSYNASDVGVYNVRVTNSLGCISDTTGNYVNVTLDPSPLKGVYTVAMGPGSCTNFISMDAAISALNARGVDSSCVFNVPANYVETVPEGGLRLGSNILNPSINAGNYTIIFQKDGAGDNPKLLAYTGVNNITSSTTEFDGIWAFVGVDNVTVQDFDLEEIATNETGATVAQINTKSMEYGFGFFKRLANDGCQNNTILNCNIRLNAKAYGNLSSVNSDYKHYGNAGILMLNAQVTAVQTHLVSSNVGGAHMNNKFLGNNIGRVINGIVLIGNPAAASNSIFRDRNNAIGSNNFGEGNNIVNFSGDTSTITNFSYGVYVNHQHEFVIAGNTIENNDGTYVDAIRSVAGIKLEGATNGSGTVNNNILRIVTKSVTATDAVYGIDILSGINGTNNTINIINNDVKVWFSSTITATNAALKAVGINGYYAQLSGTHGPARLNINNNHVHDILTTTTNTVNGAANWTKGIQVFAAANYTIKRLQINNNLIENIHKVGYNNASAPNASMPLAGIYATRSDTLEVIGNEVKHITGGYTTTGQLNNAIGGIVLSGNASHNCIATVSNNLVDSVRSINASLNGAAHTVGLIITGANTSDGGNFKTITVIGNQVSNVILTPASANSYTGAANSQVMGMLINMTTAGNPVGSSITISQNKIENIYTDASIAAQVMGIQTSGAETITIQRNHISKLFAGNLAALPANNSSVKGIMFLNNIAPATSSNVIYNIVNNMISLDLTQAVAPAANGRINNANVNTNGLTGIDVTNTQNNLTFRSYYNTILLKGNGGGTNFSAANIFLSSNATKTDFRNNILINEAEPGALGVATPLRWAAFNINNHDLSSNNNLLWAEQTANKPIMRYATNNVITLVTFQTTLMTDGRESNTFVARPIFVDEANNDLHIDPDGNCAIAGRGVPIPGFTIDYDNEDRDLVAPQVGADEFENNGGIPYTWAGVNTDWEDPVNWCTGVPQSDHNVIIPADAPNFPVLTTTSNEVGSINIQPGASITIANGGELSVYGGAFVIDGSLTNNGLIRFVGTNETTVSGAGTIPVMNSFEVNNAGGVRIQKDIAVTEEIRPTNGNLILDNATITLRSTPTSTAYVSEVKTGAGFTYIGSGKFSSETYIASNNNAAWRFLSINTNTTQTIREAWMEGQTAGTYTSTGYGTQIVGPFAAGSGFDINNGLHSMKVYNSSIDQYDGVAGTDVPINNDKGYMIFVRGDRGANAFGLTSNTILRTQGPIKLGPLTFNHNTANQFVSVGNPYPSRIDFNLLGKTNIQSNSVWVWDPKSNLFQTLTDIGGGTFIATPGGGSYDGSGHNFIESGQAFLVYTTGASASLAVQENHKAVGSVNVTRNTNVPYGMLRANIYNVSNTAEPQLLDGTLHLFDGEFSNEYLNDEDARKLTNVNEEIAIQHDDIRLAVDRRHHPVQGDTLFFNTVRMKQNTPYRINIIASGVDVPSGVQAWLEDTYTGSRVLLNLDAETPYDFTVNSSAAANPNRFRIVFAQAMAAPVPVRFVNIEAVPVGKDVRVKWDVAEEINTNNYTVQRSYDGRNFHDVGTVEAMNLRSYSHVDVMPGTGVIYYRVRSNGHQPSDVQYTRIVNVMIDATPGMITVYPNPVPADGVVKVQITDMPEGKYEVRLTQSNGKEVLRQVINHTGGSASYPLELSRRIPKGVYMLSIGNSDRKTTIKIVY